MKIYRVSPAQDEFMEEGTFSRYFGSKAKATAWLKRHNRSLWKQRVDGVEENLEYVEENWHHGDVARSVLDNTRAKGPEPFEPSEVERLIVPTDKQGLLIWLNMEFGGAIIEDNEQ